MTSRRKKAKSIKTKGIDITTPYLLLLMFCTLGVIFAPIVSIYLAYGFAILAIVLALLIIPLSNKNS